MSPVSGRILPVGESHGTTLSIHADGKGGRNGPRPEPVLVLALECGRPRAGSVRYRLSDLTVVRLGRGSERRAEKAGTELTIRVPDKWMSHKHARIEPSFGRWCWSIPRPRTARSSTATRRSARCSPMAR